MRRIIAMLLVFVMLFGILPSGYAAEESADAPVVEAPAAEEAPAQEDAPAPEEAPAEEAEPEAREAAQTEDEEPAAEEETGSTGGDAETLAPPPGGGGGIQRPGEQYYHSNHRFGYDSMVSGGTVIGAAVSVGSASLTEGNASSTNAAALENGVTITFEPGYYLHSYKIVCGDKYSCNTAAQGLAVNVSNVMSGATQASYTVTLTKTALGHSSEKGPYWILLDIRQDDTEYKVTYNWGILEGRLTNAAPATETHLVNDVVTVKEGNADAIAQAEAMGYRFLGWSNSVDNRTYQPGGQFGMPARDVALTALWEVIPLSLTVTKVWDDGSNQDGIRPESILLQLYANGTATGSPVTVTGSGNTWTYTFSNLPRFAEDGSTITYTADEVSVPEGYTKSVSGNTITNTHTPEVTSVSGGKTWDDAGNQDGKRPESITIRLYANGTEVASRTVTAEDGWKWTFENLPRYTGGIEITYTIGEDAVENYEAAVDGYNVTNSYIPETVQVSGTKTWNDADNRDGKRPASITINLLADGEVIDTITVTEEDGWKWEFNDLPKYEKGVEIVYTITEDAVTGYTTQVNGYNVTNTHVPETVSVEGSKTWNDADNQDGKRPESITIRLLANGEVIKTITVTAEDAWKWSFTDLPKYEAGVEITYTITEDAVEGYTTEVNGYNVTNTHVPETVSVEGGKTWNDADNQDGKRPASITIRLLADGEVIDTVTVTEAEGWKWSFTDLPKYAFGKVITYTIAEDAVADYTSQVSGYNVTNTHVPETITVEGAKTWDDADNQDGKRPQLITIILSANGEVIERIQVGEEEGWKWSFADLPKYANGQQIEYTISEVAVTGYETTVDGYNVTNTHIPETISVEGKKVWDDADNQDGMRPASITVSLLANGEVIDTVTVTAEDEWKWSFVGLPKYEAGVEITYTVSEAAVEGYDTTYSGYNIINAHVPSTIRVEGSKTWDDENNQDGKRPASITIHLLSDGQVIDTVTVTAEDDWAWSFSNLPEYRDGVKIVYTVSEDAVAGYTATVDGYNVTNTHIPEKIDISGSKTWADANNQDGLRPEKITINLLADGVKIDSVEVTSQDGWQWSFLGLPKYADGVEIVYTITEESVDGYETKVDGFNVTNSHVPSTVSVEGAKTWDDNDNQDGKRPESITVNLLADGEVIDSVTVTEADGWAWSFTDLPEFKAGVRIAYTVTEEAVEGYTATVDGYNITNTHVPETVTVEGAKTWDDAGNQDGKRPELITITLWADGEKVDFLNVTAEDGWAWSFDNLPKYANGQEIEYTITEVAVSGYTTTVDGYNVTNTYTPETITVEGAKTWDDSNDQDGKRPESITVNLLANGEKVDTTTVTEADGWAWSFTDLPKYENGVDIVYTVSEEAVEGYTAAVDGYNITNTRTPETVSVEGSKSWQDGNDQDGIRPDSITVNLLANGEKVDTATVTAENEWKWSFTDLPKYADGQRITYTIEEVAVEGYTTTVVGFNLINVHIPEKVTVSGTKTWVDGDDQDGIRPDSITVNLLADGVKIDSVTVRASLFGGWRYEFKDLPKYADGKLIVYTVEEEAVEGYTTTVSGYNITNTHETQETQLTVKKVWSDKNDENKKRPTSVKVTLYADGKSTGKTMTLSAAGSWTGVFRDLPKNDGGKEIKYTVREENVANYAANYSYSGTTVTVTNTFSSIPKTGDFSNVQTHMTLMSISAAALVVLAIISKRKFFA